MSDVKEATRKPDAARTRADILAVAREEFVSHGLNGARVDAIAEKTRTTKRMIYYYFGSKEGLYSAVLEEAYGDIRRTETGLDLEALDPETAMRRLIEFTFDYHETHPDFVRLIAIENIHQAQYLRQMATFRKLNADAIAIVDAILGRGRTAGVFQQNCTGVEVHWLISSLCFYRVSNRYTFGTIFDYDMTDADIRARHRQIVVDTVLGWLRAAPSS